MINNAINETTKATIETEPIRNLDDLERLYNYLIDNKTYRDYFLVKFLTNTGLRIGDALKLRVRDVQTPYLSIIEAKTGKRKLRIPLDGIREDINTYTRNMDRDDVLFPSRKGDKAITRITAFRIIDEAGKAIGIDISPHSLRKTFGYHYYNDCDSDIETLRKTFNHSNTNVTRRYIGIDSDEVTRRLEQRRTL